MKSFPDEVKSRLNSNASNKKLQDAAFKFTEESFLRNIHIIFHGWGDQ